MQQKSPHEAASLLGCDLRTAKERLAQAQRTLRQRAENIRLATDVILADGVVRQEINRHDWEDVALGLKRVA
jgi:hypothetical protein